MSWIVVMDTRAKKFLRKIPKKDATRIIRWTLDVEDDSVDPLKGDVKKLKKYIAGYRKRIGAYRIFFDVHKNEIVIYIVDVRRRTSTTYK